MGMDLHVDLGLYFEIDSSLVVPSKVCGKRCSNPECYEHQTFLMPGSDRFCKRCGNALESVSREGHSKTPNAYDFCEAVFDDGEYLASNHDGLSDRVWIYNRRLDCIRDKTRGGNSLSHIVELGAGTLDLSVISAPYIISEALKEDPQLARVVPEFYAHFNLPDSKPGLIVLKFGIVAYVC